MKESVNKGFKFYFIIFIVIVVAVVLSIGAIMIISPGVKILGYQYVDSKYSMVIETYDGNDKVKTSKEGVALNLVDNEGKTIEKKESGVAYISFNSLEKLVIKTNGMGVSFRYSGEEDKIQIERNTTGFSKEDTVKELVATKHYDKDTQTFIITAFDTTPGLVLTNNSVIIVYFAKEDTKNLNIEVETNSSSLNIASSSKNSTRNEGLTFNSLNFKTKKGNLTLASAATIKNSIQVASEENTNINIRKDQELASSFKATLKSGDINVANLTASSMEVIGDVVNVSGKVLTLGSGKGLDLKVKKGEVIVKEVVGSVEDVDSLAENLRIKIDKISGKFIMDKLDIDKANIADVTIGEIKGETLIRVSSGNVKVKNAHDKVTIQTKSGTISLKNEEIFDLKSTSGNILVNAQIVVGKNTINSGSGNITLNYLNTDGDFEINATTSNENAITFKPENKTYKEKNVVGYPTPLDELDEGETLARKITIETKAKITISALKKLAEIK